MKYLKLFESFYEHKIHELCEKYNIKNYSINTDGSIDVYHGIIISVVLRKLPIKFNKVNGCFYCDSCDLETLEGAPVELNSDFYCDHNKLTSFQFAPKRIGGDFICDYNNIKSFEYFPNYIKGCFTCYNNPIFEVWNLFQNWTKIELLNDFDIFRNEDTDEPSIFIERLNDFLEMIGEDPVKDVEIYKNI